MKYYDISLPLHQGMVSWPVDTKFQRTENRGRAITSKLIMSSHTGTHIDAPRHFLFDRGGVDGIGLEKLIGQAKVFALSSKNQISQQDIANLPIKKGDRILFKTRNSKLLKLKKFTSNYVSLSLEAAQYLAAKKISLVGIDYFGIEAKGSLGHPVHKTLLRAGIVIIEGLNLSQVKRGNYHLAALPLKIKAGDGSPCRAVLWR